MVRWRRSVSAVPLVSAAAVVVVPGGVKLAAKGFSFTLAGFALALAPATVAAGCAVAAAVEVAVGVVAATDAAGATAAE
jgi:hypothetical protein